LGTRLVCAAESIAHPAFKQAFFKGEARDAQPSVQVDPGFPVIPVRALQNKATARFIEFQHETIAEVRNGALESKEAQLKIEHFWAGALRRAVIEGDVENGSLMAGQSVGMVKTEQPVAEILADLRAQAVAALEARTAV
jgi:enoyl-[acyl-carrier protein] reductase II